MNLPSRKPLSVLIVEDSVVVRARLRALLAEETDVNVIAEAASAVEAIERFNTHVPDAVVLDLQLASGSGLDVLQRIRQSAPQCVVIMLTNFAQAEFREACRKHGADHFFHKATEFERVVEVLSALASRSPASGPALPSPLKKPPPAP
jgi:DNA-binding NarL/FixJ family response regulator